MPLPLASRAPAKINLSLHVLGRRADGYHELESLVAFGQMIAILVAISLGILLATLLAGSRQNESTV